MQLADHRYQQDDRYTLVTALCLLITRTVVADCNLLHV
jgi:hypothetical protein